jgi:hypothetical protein
MIILNSYIESAQIELIDTMTNSVYKSYKNSQTVFLGCYQKKYLKYKHKYLALKK